MNQRYSWEQIREQFNGQWVELVQYHWPWRRATPTWAIVKEHASDYSALQRVIASQSPTSGSVVMFVGAPESVVSFEPSVANL